jgi:hypothetical protein
MPPAPERPSIAIVLHEKDFLFAEGKNHLSLICAHWKKKGYPVRVQRGIQEAVPEDILFPHVDLTVLPKAYRDFFSRHPRVINRGITDISKRAISRQRLRHGSGYVGPVIVKTNANSGGGADEKKLNARGRRWKRWRNELAKRFPKVSWWWLREMNSNQYPVFPALADVPFGAFCNPHLIVEKFLPERDGDLYCARSHSFLGSAHYDNLLKSPYPIAKGSQLCRRQEIPAHPEVLDYRRSIGMTYGKIDYTIIDGHAVILDVNTTPTFLRSNDPLTRLDVDRLTPLLAEGLESIIRSFSWNEGSPLGVY